MLESIGTGCIFLELMKKIAFIIGVIFTAAILQACQFANQFKPISTPLPTITHTPTNTVSPTAAPTNTVTFSPTPTITPSPTETPTPTLTPIIQSDPVTIELTGHLHEDRPQLSGTVRFVDTQHFRIFYTMSGEDAIQVSDGNGNAIPDYVEEVAFALEHSWDVEIDQLGWAEPPPDDDLGGNDLFDVYLEDLDRYIIGYVSGGDPSNKVGDNSRTDIVETTASFSHMGLDNDFAEIEEIEDIKLSGMDFMRTTVAHEFNHTLQYGYDSEEPHRWFWEATATWVETYVWEDIKDSDTHITAAFKSPDSCLLDYGGWDRVESAGHWYALWVFLRYMSENLQVTIIRDIWEKLVTLDGYDGFEAALANYGTTLNEVFQGYTVALLLRNFEYDLEYPTVRLEGVVEGITSWAPNDGVGQMGADFVEIDASGIIEISLWKLTEGIVVGIRDGEADIFHLQDAKTTVNADDYDHVYLIVLNLDRAESMDDCRMTPYRVRVLKGEEAATPDETLPANHFEIPSVEPLEDPNARYEDDNE